MSEQRTPERLQVRVARTAADVVALRESWAKVSWLREEAECDFILARARSRPGVIEPFGVLVSAGEEPVAGAAGRIELQALRTTVGYRVVYAPTVRMLRIVDGGLVATDPAAVAPLIAALEATLAEGGLDALTLPALPVDSELFAAARELGGALEQQRFLMTSTRRHLVLPDTFDEFLRSRSRKTRFGVRRSAGAGFVDTPEERAVTEVGLEHGWVRAYVLYRRDEPIAYWLCSVHRGTILLRTTGFDHAYASHRVGVYLLMRVIEDACADPALHVLDFGPGDAPYKRHFSSESLQERSIVVFAPTTRGRRINGLRTVILGSALLARRAADATNLTERIKGRWRARLRARP